MLPASYVPVNEDSNVRSGESRFLRLSKALNPNETLLIRLCGNYVSGHSAFGYFYFNLEGRPHHSQDFPEDYEDKIGFSYDAKRKAEAQSRDLDPRRDERDVPKKFAALTAIAHKCPADPKAAQSYDDGRLVIVDLTQINLLEMIDTLFAEEEYAIEDNGLANYVIKITRLSKGGKTSYSPISLMKRVSKTEQALWDAEGGPKVYVPAIFSNGDPFEGRPADGALEDGGVRPVAAKRDDLGADELPY
jgi:hypothetical protein